MKTKIFHILLLVGSLATSLLAQDQNPPSKKELFLRARDVLQTSLENKDYETANQAFGYLQENISEGAPLDRFEEYLIQMEMGRYDDGIRNYAHQRRILLDSTFHPQKNMRITEEDGLHNYLFNKFKGFSKVKADSMVNLVDASDASQESKDLYASLIYAELVVGVKVYTTYSNAFLVHEVADTTCAEDFLKRAHKFVDNYPNSEHAGYLKNSTIPLVEGVVTRLREFRKDPFAYKYYSSSTSLFIGKWIGTTTGGVNDYLDTKMGSSWIFDASFQVWRFTFGLTYSFGTIHKLNQDLFATEDHDGLDSYFGITAGFDVFDIKYLKVEPFLGIGGYNFNNDWLDTDRDDVTVPVFVLGTNFDVRLYATKPHYLGDISFAIMLRFKYFAQIGIYKDDMELKVPDPITQSKDFHCNKGFANHTFGISLGVGLW